MVSQLSSRLLGRCSDSNNSSKCKESSRKRLSVTMPTRPESSISGYSADREDPSLSPPVLSIGFHGRDNRSRNDGDHKCPKRQKRYELQYAASTVKADLARAGKDMPNFAENIKKRSSLGEGSIDVNCVKLMMSRDAQSPFVLSEVSAQTSLYEYETMARACLHAYPSSYTSLKRNKAYVTAQSSDNSTSSVSDTESDSISSHGNLGSQSLVITPLLEDSFDASAEPTPLSNIQMSSCNIISCPSNAVTMSEMLQLSGFAR